ncbi:hypothetical protein GCM10010442_23710 [Kitasatospora kifunensis]
MPCGTSWAADADPAAISGVAPAATRSAAWAIRRERGRDMVLLRSDGMTGPPGGRRDYRLRGEKVSVAEGKESLKIA